MKGNFIKPLIVAVAVAVFVATPALAVAPVPVMKVIGADFYTLFTHPPADRGAQWWGFARPTLLE